MFEQIQLENNAKGDDVEINDYAALKLESACSEFEKLSMELEAVKQKRDLAKNGALNEKKKAEEIRQNLAELLGCDNEQKVIIVNLSNF